MTRVAVTGGRDYKNRKRIYQVLDAAVERLGMTFLIQGSADGLDYLAWQWSDERGFPCGSFAADWCPPGSTKIDRSAGPKRNQRMLDSGIDVLLAFPGGIRSGGVGTQDMIDRCRKAGVRVIQIDRS